MPPLTQSLAFFLENKWMRSGCKITCKLDVVIEHSLEIRSNNGRVDFDLLPILWQRLHDNLTTAVLNKEQSRSDYTAKYRECPLLLNYGSYRCRILKLQKYLIVFSYRLFSHHKDTNLSTLPNDNPK